MFYPKIGWWQFYRRAFLYTVTKYRLAKNLAIRTKTKSGTCHHIKGFDLAIAEKAIQLHRQMKTDSPEKMLKFDKKRSVSHVEFDRHDYAVKEFINARASWRFSHDRHNWYNSFILKNLGFPVGQCLAWLQTTRNAFILMEYLGQKTLMESVCTPELSQKNSTLIEKAIRTIGELHRHGIYHRDLKPENWIVNSGGELFLIDLEDARFWRKIGEKESKKALVQLLKRIPFHRSDQSQHFEELYHSVINQD
jgi:serine/threonine protein kinase